MLALVLAAFAEPPARERIEVKPGHSVVLELAAPHRIARVTAPETARAMVLDAQTLMIQGVALGTTDLTVTYEGSDRVEQWDLVVTRHVEPVRERVDGMSGGRIPE